MMTVGRPRPNIWQGQRYAFIWGNAETVDISQTIRVWYIWLPL